MPLHLWLIKYFALASMVGLANDLASHWIGLSAGFHVGTAAFFFAYSFIVLAVLSLPSKRLAWMFSRFYDMRPKWRIILSALYQLVFRIVFTTIALAYVLLATNAYTSGVLFASPTPSLSGCVLLLTDYAAPPLAFLADRFLAGWSHEHLRADGLSELWFRILIYAVYGLAITAAVKIVIRKIRNDDLSHLGLASTMMNVGNGDM